MLTGPGSGRSALASENSVATSLPSAEAISWRVASVCSAHRCSALPVVTAAPGPMPRPSTTAGARRGPAPGGQPGRWPTPSRLHFVVWSRPNCCRPRVSGGTTASQAGRRQERLGSSVGRAAHSYGAGIRPFVLVEPTFGCVRGDSSTREFAPFDRISSHVPSYVPARLTRSPDATTPGHLEGSRASARAGQRGCTVLDRLSLILGVQYAPGRET